MAFVLTKRQTVACMCAVLAHMATAQTKFERIGPTYPIAEQPADEAIVNALKEKERSGELKRLEQEAIKRSVKTAKEPTPVEGLTRTSKLLHFEIDATLVVKDDIKDPLGNVVVAAGSTINPLEVMGLTQVLVFFDARDIAQIELAEKLIRNSTKKVVPILTAGSWYELAKSWKRTVYFDQKGALTQRFGIRTLPSTVEQIGSKLILTNIPVTEAHNGKRP
jgi:conjugal transfer pilus assembly protein TraW